MRRLSRGHVTLARTERTWPFATALVMTARVNLISAVRTAAATVAPPLPATIAAETSCCRVAAAQAAAWIRLVCSIIILKISHPVAFDLAAPAALQRGQQRRIKLRHEPEDI